MSGKRSNHGKKYTYSAAVERAAGKKGFENLGVDWRTINGCCRNRMGGCKTAETVSRGGKVASSCEEG
jgi:hypothetical protein